MERLSTSRLHNSLRAEQRGEEVVLNMQNTLNFPSASGGFSCTVFQTPRENYDLSILKLILGHVKGQEVGLQMGFCSAAAL